MPIAFLDAIGIVFFVQYVVNIMNDDLTQMGCSSFGDFSLLMIQDRFPRMGRIYYLLLLKDRNPCPLRKLARCSKASRVRSAPCCASCLPPV